MKTYSSKQQENNSRAAANSVSQKKMAANNSRAWQAVQLMTSVIQRETPAPPTHISMDDVRGVAADVGGLGTHAGREGDSFLADEGLTYPHIHIWADGTIALSIRRGVNTKIGKDDQVEIDKLIDANRRFAPGGKVGELVGRICASAS